MEEKNKNKNKLLLQTSREINEDMIYYWTEKIIEKALNINKSLKDLVILISWITYRKWVKELYHSRNLALAKHIQSKWFNLRVNDEMYNKNEIEDLGFIFWEKWDIEFDCFELKIK